MVFFQSAVGTLQTLTPLILRWRYFDVSQTDGKEYDDLYTAALCRERADWIMGSNAECADSENDEEEQNGNADILAYITALIKGSSYPLQNPSVPAKF